MLYRGRVGMLSKGVAFVSNELNIGKLTRSEVEAGSAEFLMSWDKLANALEMPVVRMGGVQE